ncbi:MAG: ABC transporter permease subunit [Candidatus Aminicenantes bacterium]|jgi:ABC-type transport system involved in multi-copper enzyme maturation permease subunit
MVWNIARKEIVANLLSYKFFIVIILTVVLVFTSFFFMYKDFKERFSDYQIIKPKPEEPIAVLPPNPLSIFAKGLDEAIARSFEVSVIGITVRAGQKSGNIVFSFFPTPDFLYVVKVVLSLVALLFGFDQVSRERERGTLKLMLSNHVSRAKVLVGKWIGNFLSLSVPFFLVVWLGFALLNLDPEIHFSSNQMVRLAFIFALTFLYIALFLSLGILISTLTRKASVSVVVLLFIWTLLVFILPNLGTLFARQVVEVPSVLALNEKRNQIWTKEVLLAIQDRDWREHYSQIHAEQRILEEDYRNKFNRLVRLSKNINRISPVASYVYAVTDLAGTGIEEEENLKKSVISYTNNILPDVSTAVVERTEQLYPAFQYRYRLLPEVFARGTLFDTTWLVFFNILFFSLSYFALAKYDAR